MKTIVVDSHNEVLPYWIKKYIEYRRPLIVVRIDKHHDMFSNCPLLPAREGRSIFEHLERIMPDIREYARRRLNEGNFTCPAFHYGIIGSLYHFDPRKERIDAYGRVYNGYIIDAPKTKMRSLYIGKKRINLIDWDSSKTKLRSQDGKRVPAPKTIRADELEDDLAESRFPIVLGLDLDGFCAIDERDSTRKAIEERLKKAKTLLECVSSPVLACIARSQTPRAYVPPELVDELEEAALRLIEIKADIADHHMLPIASTGSIRDAFLAG